MADSTQAQIVMGDNSLCVAYALLLGIAAKENKTSFLNGFPIVKADKEWVFKTYQECYQAVVNR